MDGSEASPNISQYININPNNNNFAFKQTQNYDTPFESYSVYSCVHKTTYNLVAFQKISNKMISSNYF